MRAIAILLVSAFVALQSPPARIVSLIPALTDMLVAIGAGPQLVAVSSYDDDPQVKPLPRVGALLDPDVERIIGLRPDLVLVYGSQQDLVTQLARASIPVYQYRHGGLAHVTATMRELGARVGRTARANAVATEIEQRIAAVKRRTSVGPRPRTLLVFGREPGTLRGIYVSGARGFLHDMLDAAGGANVFADTTTESVQASSELILARAPDVIIELQSKEEPSSTAGRTEIDSWKALSSVPAVRNGRVHVLVGKSLNVPGPLVAEGVEQLARLLHPDIFK
jgi:iron complex transport system substrate-binding protein